MQQPVQENNPLIYNKQPGINQTCKNHVAISSYTQESRTIIYVTIDQKWSGLD